MLMYEWVHTTNVDYTYKCIKIPEEKVSSKGLWVNTTNVLVHKNLVVRVGPCENKG